MKHNKLLQHSRDRRTALRLLALTAASWFGSGSLRAPTADQPQRIGFPNGSINLVLLQSLGLLERRHLGAIQWIELPASPQRLEALAAGSVAFGALGAIGGSPPVFAQAAGKALFSVGAARCAPHRRTAAGGRCFCSVGPDSPTPAGGRVRLAPRPDAGRPALKQSRSS